MGSGGEKTVAIIGCGPAGLSATKNMLEQGLTPTVFEKSEDIGGVWSPRGYAWNGMSGTNARFTQGFAEFPMTKEWCDVEGLEGSYIKRETMLKYYRAYADHFKIIPYVRFNCEVKQLRQIDGGRWKVVSCGNGGEEKTEEYDFAVVATGFFSKPFIPEFKGVKDFKGKIIHASEYFNKDDFAGQKIAVIGGSFSGAEICEQLCTVSPHVTNITRLRRLIISRKCFPQPGVWMPIDAVIYSRGMKKESLEIDIAEGNKQNKQLIASLFPAQQEINELQVDQDNPCFNISCGETYLSEVKAGRIKVKNGRVTKFVSNGFFLDTGDFVEVDAVVLATGYNARYDYMDDEMRRAIEYYSAHHGYQGSILLDRVTWPRRYQNLAFVGYSHSFLCLAMIPMSAKWAALVFAGKLPHPTAEEIERGINKDRTFFELSHTNLMQCPHAHSELIADEIAAAMGCLPDFPKMKKENPELFTKMWYGIWSLFQYGEKGPAGDGKIAAQMVEEAWELLPEIWKDQLMEKTKSLKI